MSQHYCPDCGAVCQPGSPSCPECRFPLELVIHEQADGIRIATPQLDAWKRISKILVRSGLRIKRQQGSSWSGNAAWLALPGLGIAILLVTLVFGGSLVNQIWEPPKITNVLDLNNPKGQSRAADDTDRGEGASAGDMDFLTDAFKVSREQLEQPLNDRELEAFVDREKASLDQITSFLNEALVTVSVSERSWRGTMVSSDLLLVDSELLTDAFRREIRTVNDDHAIREEAFWIVPRVGHPGGEEADSSKVIDGELIGITLLRSEQSDSISFKSNYDNDIQLSDYVWIGRIAGGKIYPEKAQVIDSTPYNDEIGVWVLETTLGKVNTGSPVFDQYGDLIGVMLVFNGDNVVVPLLTIRERTPLIFKEVMR